MTEVIDPTEDLKSKAECFGTYDVDFNECLHICQLSERCKAHTQNVSRPRAAAPAPAKEEIEELPDMDPKDYLIESLKGRYEVQYKQVGGGLMIAARKEGRLAIKIRLLEDGQCLIEVVSNGAKLRVPKLESVRQVLHIYQAILVI